MPNEGSFEAAKRKSDLIRADFEVNPGKYRMLTGDRPTGRLHLGHYFGTLKGRVDLQNRGIRTNIVIADYQVITDRDTTANIADNVYNIVIDYLACGIDPQKTMIFTHSSVPALNQLMLPFLSLVSESELERNPTVKAEQEASGHALTGLLLTCLLYTSSYSICMLRAPPCSRAKPASSSIRCAPSWRTRPSISRRSSPNSGSRSPFSRARVPRRHVPGSTRV